VSTCNHKWSEETHEGVLSRCCNVCNEWGIEVEYDPALLAIHNVAALAKRIRKTDPENAEHLVRFCREAGVEDSVTRAEADAGE
jgi:hypothetical protein